MCYNVHADPLESNPRTYFYQEYGSQTAKVHTIGNITWSSVLLPELR